MVNVSIEYYNSKEKELFEKYSNYPEVSSFVNGQQKISKDELLAYMMFTEQKDYDGFRNYKELKERISKRLGDINDYFDFSNGSLASKFVGNEMDKNLIERFGVGIGLATISKLHDLTEADWKRIPEVSGKNGFPTFDFDISIASDGNKFIQVENKGSAVENKAYKCPTISNHYRSIKEKKEDIRKKENSNILYGTIGVLDNSSINPARVLLVDPPADFVDFDPKKYKLLARLYYYLDEFNNIGVKRKIIDALSTRIKEISKSTNYSRFNNKPLDYKYPVAYHLFMENKMFAAIDYNEAFGKFFMIKYKNEVFPYLLAYPKALMKLILSQKFEAILSYQYDPAFIKEKVNVILRIGKNDKIDLENIEKLGFRLDERRGTYFEASYFCNVKHSLSGRLYGQLSNFKD